MKNSDLFASIHSVETCGTVDGPGLRYVAFFQGCNLRCRYCHNPDTWQITSVLSPLTQASAAGSAFPRVMTVEELVADVLKYKTFMNFSGGGFTASGGEPMLQVQFLAELFGQLKFYGIHTALDTSGHHNSQYAAHNARLLEKTDLILLDIKSINPEKYHALTSVDILPTLELLELARDKQIPVWVRYVVVPGLTDSLEEAQELARFLTTFDNVKRVEVQPFHKMGEYKWAELNIPYTLGDTPPPSEAVVADIERAFREKSLPV